MQTDGLGSAEQPSITSEQNASVGEGDRLALLRGYFLDIADQATPIQPGTSEYIRRGNSLRLCLNEIEGLSAPSEHEVQAVAVRSEYMNALLHRPVIRGRAARTDHCSELEKSYVDVLVAKIERVVDAATPQDALELGQMPTIIEDSSFDERKQLSIEDLAGNHLYLLTDTALREHIARRQHIEGYRQRSTAAKVLGNRALRMSVAGSVFIASLVPNIGVLPAGWDLLGGDIDVGLQTLSAIVFGVELPEATRLKYLATKHDKRTQALHEQLAESEQLSDLALRIAYSSTRYGGPDLGDNVTGRSGSSDKAENLHHFSSLDEEFTHLNNDPGGKPYSGDQSLGYAARLLIERNDQLEKIIAADTQPLQQKKLFLELSRDIIVEDLARMRKGLSLINLRKGARRVAFAFPAILFPSYISTASDATALSRDTTDVLKPGSEQDPDYE
jgi:hypothetical protein